MHFLKEAHYWHDMQVQNADWNLDRNLLIHISYSIVILSCLIYTTRFTCNRSVGVITRKRSIHLKESLQPPHLEDTLSDQNTELEYGPPFYSCVGTFCCVSVRALAYDNVRLLVFDLG